MSRQITWIWRWKWEAGRVDVKCCFLLNDGWIHFTGMTMVTKPLRGCRRALIVLGVLTPISVSVGRTAHIRFSTQVDWFLWTSLKFISNPPYISSPPPPSFTKKKRRQVCLLCLFYVYFTSVLWAELTEEQVVLAQRRNVHRTVHILGRIQRIP